MSRRGWFLTGCVAVLTVLWLPSLRYPVVSDTVRYAELGRSLWEDGRYALDGEPYALHLPLHAALSYPFTRTLGLHAGMHALSLLGGIAVLIVTFFLVRRFFGIAVGMLATIAVLAHPGFLFLATTGSADLTFASLFLGSVLAYAAAESDRRWYLLCGALAGLACLTRYNGAPLFGLFLLHALLERRTDLRSGWFWGGMALGAGIFGTWFLRNFLVFGDPFYSGYRTELAKRGGMLPNVSRNLLYYANPIHNVFPFFFPFVLYGLWKHGRSQPLLSLAMVAGLLLALVWWVQAIRFAFPGIVILLVFAAAGLADVARRAPRVVAAIILAAGIALQSLSVCLYASGACNARFDRSFGKFLGGIVPADMGLSTEGMYAWGLARDFIARSAPPACGAYVISREPPASGEQVVFETEASPVTRVLLQECTAPVRPTKPERP